MKTMKYRSISALAVATMLSVFLFTSCEKESDGDFGNYDEAPANRLEKFKRLKFSGSSAEGSTTDSQGSGTFIGNGNNVSYTGAESTGNSQFVPENPEDAERGFTDPMSSGPEFAVFNPFSAGGGSLTIDGEDFDLDFGFCAESDVLQIFGGSDSSNQGGEDSPANLQLFIGVSGDFDPSKVGENDLGVDLIFYAFSYNGATKIGDFTDFEGEDDPENLAFVIAVKFGKNEMGEPSGDFFFATEGSINFAGSEVIINGAKMAKVEFGEQGMDNSLGSKLVDLSASLECVSADDFGGE